MNIHVRSTPADQPVKLRQRTIDKIARNARVISLLQTLPDMAEREKGWTAPWSYFASLEPRLLNARQWVGLLHDISYAFEHNRRGRVPSCRPAFMYRLANQLMIWESKASVQAAAFTPTDWSDVFAGYARMRVIPGPALLQVWQTHGLNALKKTAPKVNELTLLMAAFGRLLIDPGETFAQFARAEIAGMRPKHLYHDYAQIMMACAWMDANASRPEYRDIAVGCRLRCYSPDHAPSIAHEQVRDASLWFAIKPQLPVRERSDAPRQSFAERSVSAVFSQLGLNILHDDAAKHFTTLDKSADIAVMTDTGGKIFVEVDGPGHFLYMAGQRERYNGPTMFQQALLRKIYPAAAVVRVPLFNFETLMKPPYQLHLGPLLRKIFRDAGAKAAEGHGLSCVLSIRKKALGLRPLTF